MLWKTGKNICAFIGAVCISTTLWSAFFEMFEDDGYRD